MGIGENVALQHRLDRRIRLEYYPAVVKAEQQLKTILFYFANGSSQSNSYF